MNKSVYVKIKVLLSDCVEGSFAGGTGFFCDLIF